MLFGFPPPGTALSYLGDPKGVLVGGLPGPKGDTGAQGPTGPQGPTGDVSAAQLSDGLATKAPASGSSYYRRARTVADTNGIDDRAAIQAILNEGVSEVVFRKGGTWTVDTATGLTLLSDTRLIVEEGASLKIKPNSLDEYRLLKLDGVHNVTLEGGGTILGDADTHTGSTGEWGHLIYITNGCADIRIRHLKVAKAWGDGIYVGGGLTAVNYDVEIDHVTVDDCRREAIAPFWVDGCVVSNCYIPVVGGTDLVGPGVGIDSEPNDGQWVKDLTIENNIVENCPGNGIHVAPLPAGSGTAPYITGVVIRDNTVNNSGAGVNVPLGMHNGSGIRVARMTGPVLEGNTVTNTGVGDPVTDPLVHYGIRVTDCTSAIVKGGSVSGTAGEGIHVDDSPSTEITGVTVSGSTSRAIWVDDGSDGTLILRNSIVDNVQNNSTVGHVTVSASAKSVIAGNTFRGYKGEAWVRTNSTGSNHLVAYNTGTGTKPTNDWLDTSTNSIGVGNVRKDVGIFEPWAGDKAGNPAATTNAATGKTTPADADKIPLVDSAAANVLKSLTWADLKAAIVAAIVDGAPATLDTLNEIAAAFADDANFATTVTNALALKASLTGTETLSGKTLVLPVLQDTSGTPVVTVGEDYAQIPNLVELRFAGASSGSARMYLTGSDRFTIRSVGSNGVAIVNAANNAELLKVADNGTITHTGKLTPRVTSTATATTLTPSADTTDQYVYTALASALAINAPTGTPVVGQRIRYRIKDDGTSRSLTWNAIFRAIGATIPVATTLGKTMYVDTVYNSTDTKWDVTDVKIEA